ncbi:hypothetical protein [Lentzea cavernae]|uniref:Transglutaminase-like superfamily protein n=1 Tax=Lentzea cavernae TaxID=2020703 RepID=A0ABQ3MVX3_9PSEU|nr:hypothetical protein [Lentzea cavernae]GHH61291.1 hypothetical protein GCM10017774_87030 [Lentzea cavernae]
MFLAAALHGLGFASSFHLGRESVPRNGVAGYFAWVECGGRVVSTTMPVTDEYVEVYRTSGG